jgi:replicative DNA helicase
MSKEKPILDRLPPHSIEAEASVLGCVLERQECFQSLVEMKCRADWFFDQRHKQIWLAYERCRAGKVEMPLDIINVQECLRQMEMLEQVGGIAYLSECQDLVPSVENLSSYAGQVRDKWKLRQLIEFTASFQAAAWGDVTSVDEFAGRMSMALENLTAPLQTRNEQPVKSILANTVLTKIEAHYTRGKQHIDGLATGLTYLDKIVRGISVNDYVVIAGRPGDGKTSLALNLCEHVALNLNEPVGVFSMEMTGDSLVERLLFSGAGVSSARFEQGFATAEDFTKLHQGAVKLSKGNIIVDDESDQTIDVIAAKARRWVKEYGIKLFVLDYLQLLDDDGSGRNNERAQQLRRISKKIVSLKKKLNVPWLVLAQMNRNIETSEVKRPPVLSDLKESGAIEQDADVVLFLYKPLKTEKIEDDEEKIQGVCGEMPWDEQPKRVNLLVAKHRDGPTGKAELIFQKNLCKFMDWNDWQYAKGLKDYGKGDRASANRLEEDEIGHRGTEAQS